MKKGFTLIEVMFALFILLVGITGVIKMYGAGSTLTRSSGDMTYAQNLAKSYLNRQLAMPPKELNNGAVPTCKDENGSAFTSKVINYNNTRYTISCTVQRNRVGSKQVGVDGDPALDLPNVPVGFFTIKVAWTDNLNTTNALKNHEVVNVGLLGMR